MYLQPVRCRNFKQKPPCTFKDSYVASAGASQLLHLSIYARCGEKISKGPGSLVYNPSSVHLAPQKLNSYLTFGWLGEILH